MEYESWPGTREARWRCSSPCTGSQQVRAGGGRDARQLDVVRFRGWYGVNMLLTVLDFIHIGVVLLCVPDLVFPHLLNIVPHFI